MPLVNQWIDTLTIQLRRGTGYTLRQMDQNLQKIAASFAKLEVQRTDKVKVGVVGEIFVKYASLGNNNLEDFLASQDCEVMVPGILGFALFKVDNRLEDIKLYGGSWLKRRVVTILMNYILKIEAIYLAALQKYPQLVAPTPYYHLKELAGGVIGYGAKMGEGWLLTAEMLELIEQGYENIVCTQPFGCLPNHICGKGMIRKIKEPASRTPISFPSTMTPAPPASTKKTASS